VVYSLRIQGIFACPASGYSSDQYIAYCQATSYGDYDYGAFWFDLEPAAAAAAAKAQVLFLGNSRTQFGLSTEATANWFSGLGIRPYLLGFSYDGNYLFEAPLLKALRPQAKVYVINLDLFFQPTETAPAREVMRDHAARERYGQKRAWQRFHRELCGALPSVCGHEAAVYRSRASGAWAQVGGAFTGHAVSYDESVDSAVVSAYTRAGIGFLAELAAKPGCVLLTYVPNVQSSIGTAKAIAAGLGLTLVAPQLEGLRTFDDTHLDPPSAERWSTAFLAAAGPQIRQCIEGP
jgi:hypothetical protein